MFSSPHDLLPASENDDKKTPVKKIFCHFCGNNVSAYLRNGYLRYYKRHKKNKSVHVYDTG
jgi:hypothetical protein